MGLLLSQPASPALAEAPTASKELVTVTSDRRNFTVKVPKAWTTTVNDLDKKRNVYSFYADFEGSIMGSDLKTDLIGFRVNQREMGRLLKVNGFQPDPGDLTADDWSTVVQGDITPEIMGRFLAEANKGYKKGAQQDQITDISIDGNCFRCRTYKDGNTDQDKGPLTRPTVTSVQALIRNGTITTAFVGSNEERWKPGYSGEYDGAYLEGLVRSLRLL
jgi:hypothetical protein